MSLDHWKKRAEARARDAMAYAREHLVRNDARACGLRLPVIQYSLKGTSAGMCSRDGGKIWLNERMLELHTERFIEETLPHEIAHSIVQQLCGPRAQPHGREWKAVMRLLGKEPSRCHLMEAPPETRRQRRYPYTCACEGRTHQITATRHNKMRKGAKYVCGICRSFLKPTTDGG